ncbi:hypothetical protein HOY80DRAFT_959603 [Tuber brumale]|nr:hypothetical protein HOY80DRAFT_959603 [Tuber brumale]
MSCMACPPVQSSFLPVFLFSLSFSLPPLLSSLLLPPLLLPFVPLNQHQQLPFFLSPYFLHSFFGVFLITLVHSFTRR